MLAVSHGQEWNASQIGKSLGLSYHTINHYMDYLEGAFLIRRLPAFHANIRKRLVKRPKVYRRDSGLLHALLDVRASEALLHQPWVGASWEGYVIEQVAAALCCSDRPLDAYYLRTSDQLEIDLLIRVDSDLWAMEAKLTARPRSEDMARLNANADLAQTDRRFLITQHREWIESGSQVICDLDGIMRYIEG